MKNLNFYLLVTLLGFGCGKYDQKNWKFLCIEICENNNDQVHIPYNAPSYNNNNDNNAKNVENEDNKINDDFNQNDDENDKSNPEEKEGIKEIYNNDLEEKIDFKIPKLSLKKKDFIESTKRFLDSNVHQCDEDFLSEMFSFSMKLLESQFDHYHSYIDNLDWFDLIQKNDYFISEKYDENLQHSIISNYFKKVSPLQFLKNELDKDIECDENTFENKLRCLSHEELVGYIQLIINNTQKYKTLYLSGDQQSLLESEMLERLRPSMEGKMVTINGQLKPDKKYIERNDHIQLHTSPIKELIEDIKKIFPNIENHISIKPILKINENDKHIISTDFQTYLNSKNNLKAKAVYIISGDLEDKYPENLYHIYVIYADFEKKIFYLLDPTSSPEEGCDITIQSVLSDKNLFDDNYKEYTFIEAEQPLQGDDEYCYLHSIAAAFNLAENHVNVSQYLEGIANGDNTKQIIDKSFPPRIEVWMNSIRRLINCVNKNPSRQKKYLRLLSKNDGTPLSYQDKDEIKTIFEEKSPGSIRKNNRYQALPYYAHILWYHYLLTKYLIKIPNNNSLKLFYNLCITDIV